MKSILHALFLLLIQTFLFSVIKANSASSEFESGLKQCVTKTVENGFVIIPPHPFEKVSLLPSTKFSATVNGYPIKVRNASLASDAWFFFCGEVELKVTFYQNINTYNISPKSLPAQISQEGNTITIKLNSPRKFVIYNVNGDPESLSVFADAPPVNVPDTVAGTNVVNVNSYISSDKLQKISNATTHDDLVKLDISAEFQRAIDDLPRGSVLYLPAGLYPVSALKLKSDMELYFFPGSILYSIRGTQYINGKDTPLLNVTSVNNTSIRGAGTIMSNGQIYSNGGDSGESRQTTMTIGGSNLVFTDFLVRDQQHWPWLLSKSENIVIRNVKILTSLDGLNRDGFGISTAYNTLIEDNYIRSGDDAIVIKSNTTDFNYKLIVRNNVIWNMNSGGGIKIGTQYWVPGVHNLAFENNDIISAPRSLSVYFQNDTHNVVDVIFKNTRCENTSGKAGANLNLMDLKMGSVKNFRLVNLFAMHNSPFDMSTKQNIDVLFDGFYRYPNGKDQPPMAITNTVPVMPANGVRFATNLCTVIGIRALLPAVSKPGIYDAFKVYRSGDLSSSLTIPYTVRSTAISGKDFTALRDSVVLEAGQSEATISVEFLDDAFKNDNKSILIALYYIPNDYVMVGTDFHAFVAIISKDQQSGISNPAFQTSNVKIFPTGSNGEFVLEMNILNGNNKRVFVFNLFGEIVFEDNVKTESAKLNISKQPKGIYLVKVKNNSGLMFLKKVIKY